MDLQDRIKCLVDGAKYDVSCSSSGSDRAAKKGKMGNCSIAGICHSFSADGRCISLLKILLTNNCIYDCAYCINRRANDIPRASITAVELCELVIGFYKRNYIEGLFLSSAVEISPEHSMQRLYEAVYLLRTKYGFGGYIHLKAIPGASEAIISAAAQLVDRMSVNIELPNVEGLKLLAPSKTREAILKPMKLLSSVQNQQMLLSQSMPQRQLQLYQKQMPRKSIPAGQTTQMIVGATKDSDATIMRLSEALYEKMGLKRVYYSAYIPLNEDSRLPSTPPDLVRENRLYQADWLLRFYGFKANELLAEGQNFARELDPKNDWALRHLELFPIEISLASHEMLMRTPGIGARSAWKIVQARKHSHLDYNDLVKMRVVLKRARHFITIGGKYFGSGVDEHLRERMVALALNEGQSASQLSLFDSLPLQI